MPSGEIGIGDGPCGGRNASAILRPARHVPPCSRCGIAKAGTERKLAAHQLHQPVHQGHGQRAPFDDELRGNVVRRLRVGRRTRTNGAEIDQQAAVSIFGKRGERVELHHHEARGFERLEQRIGEPLGQLVERHDVIGGIAPKHRGMAAGVADGQAMHGQARRPDRRQALEQGGEHRRGGNFPIAADAQKIVDQMAGTRGRPAVEVGPLGERGSEPAQQCASPLQADQRIARIGLEMARQRAGVEPGEADIVDAMGSVGIGGESAGAKHVEAGDREPFGAFEHLPGARFAIAPRIARPGVEQNADGRQVDGDARLLDAVRADRVRKRAPAVDAAGREMAPAAVIGDVQVGIGGARHLRHIAGDGRKLRLVEREMGRAPVGDPAMHHAAALAHRRAAQESRRFVCWSARRVRSRRSASAGSCSGHSSRPRPTASGAPRRGRSPAK